MCGATSRKFCGTVSGASAKLTMCMAAMVVATAEALGDVAQRQEIERLVGLGERQADALEAAHLEDDVAMVSIAPLEGPVVPEV